ncbi:MAG: diaminopimelate epimerase [Planctomycetia bacterium]|nr:diaminopimelate epimerase [Planctomycetia bacterium]
MRFTKMHGSGNDYVYVNCFDQPPPENLPELARRVSDRHRGIGGDGLILIHPSDVADARMQMFNADGSESEMCGNGLRCVGKYVYDHGLCRRSNLRIETGAGVLLLDLEVADGHIRQVRIDMGEPILQGLSIPTTWTGDTIVNAELRLDAGVIAGLPRDVKTLAVTCVSMGNPHCVTYVDELSDDWVLGVGPRIENDRHFPNRVNAEFVEVLSPTEARMRVWERGSGETLACGTGACAVCVAGVLTGRTGRAILAHLPGGDLRLEWSEQDNHVRLTGPAVEVFSAEWE